MGRKLNHRQVAFVEHYLQCWNASEAARRAGYSTATAGQIGFNLLKKVEITDEIARRLNELKAGADEVVTRLTSHARGSMEDFIDVKDDGTAVLNLIKAKEGRQLHLIKKLKTTRRNLKEGESEVVNEIEMYDVQAALVQIGRVHSLFNDKITLDWREAARKDGHDPEKLLEAAVKAIEAAQAGVTPATVQPAGDIAQEADDAL